MVSIIKNTTDNNTIVESLLEYESEIALEELEQYIKLSYVEKIIREIFSKMNLIFNEKLNKDNDLLVINHSFTIKKYYFRYLILNMLEKIIKKLLIFFIIGITWRKVLKLTKHGK